MRAIEEYPGWEGHIRNSFPSQIAEKMCAAIDGHERTEHFDRLLMESNERMRNQQLQQKVEIFDLNDGLLGNSSLSHTDSKTSVKSCYFILAILIIGGSG